MQIIKNMKNDTAFVKTIFVDYGLPIMSDEELAKADFENRGKIHEWKNYVSELYVKEWHNLTYRERVIIYCEAQKQADREEWD